MVWLHLEPLDGFLFFFGLVRFISPPFRFHHSIPFSPTHFFWGGGKFFFCFIGGGGPSRAIFIDRSRGRILFIFLSLSLSHSLHIFWLFLLLLLLLLLMLFRFSSFLSLSLSLFSFALGPFFRGLLFCFIFFRTKEFLQLIRWPESAIKKSNSISRERLFFF